MKFWYGIGFAIACAGVAPGLAWAAEGAGEGAGSWLHLGFFAANFLLFVLIVLYGIGPIPGALPFVRQSLTERGKAIRRTVARAESAFAEAQEFAGRASAAIAALEEEKRSLAAELQGETAYLIGRINEAARQSVARIGRDSELTAAAMLDEARGRVRHDLARAAAALAAELISRSLTVADQARLTDSFMETLGQEAQR